MDCEIFYADDKFRYRIHIPDCEMHKSGKFVDDFSGRHANMLVQIFADFRQARLPLSDHNIVAVFSEKKEKIEVSGRAMGFIAGRYCIDAKSYSKVRAC